MDSRHEIIITEQGNNRGRNFLIGIAVIGLILYLWFHDNNIRNLVNFAASGDKPQGFSSVSYSVISVLFDVVTVVGAVAAAISWGVWAVICDFAKGIGEAIAAWKAKNSALAAAQDAAKQAAVAAATLNATAQGFAEQVTTESGAVITFTDVVSAVQTVADELDELKKRFDAVPLFTGEHAKTQASRTKKRPSSSGQVSDK